MLHFPNNLSKSMARFTEHWQTIHAQLRLRRFTSGNYLPSLAFENCTLEFKTLVHRYLLVLYTLGFGNHLSCLFEFTPNGFAKTNVFGVRPSEGPLIKGVVYVFNDCVVWLLIYYLTPSWLYKTQGVSKYFDVVSS